MDANVVSTRMPVESPVRLSHFLSSIISTALIVLSANGCVSSEGAAAGRAERRAIGNLGAGFVDPAKPPAPESTIWPKPGSWASVHPPPGYRVVLLTAGDDQPTRTLTTSVREWASAERVHIDVVAEMRPRFFVDAIVAAMSHDPDLIVCAGASLVEPLALVTASHLDQQFLVLGAQLPEPTMNVTAAVWRGASTRGTEVSNGATSFNPLAYTAPKAHAALRAGVASVLHDITGIVVALD